MLRIVSYRLGISKLNLILMVVAKSGFGDYRIIPFLVGMILVTASLDTYF